MFKTTIVVLVLIFAASIMYTQNRIMCSYEPDSPPVFSADNVKHICSQGGTVPDVTEARWHRSGLIAAILGRTGKDEVRSMAPVLSDMDFTPGAGWIGRSFVIDETFTQLEVTIDKIIVGTNTGSLSFWDWEQKTFLYELSVSNGEVTELLLHPSDEWLLVVIDYTRLFRFDLESQTVAEIHAQFGESQMLRALAFSSDGLLLAAAGDGSIGIWDTDTWEMWLPNLLPAESVGGLLFAEDDSELIVLTDASVSRWSLSDKNLRFVRELEPYPSKRTCRISAGDISPDGSLLMTTDICSQLRAWDLAVDREIFIPQLDFADDEYLGTAIYFSPDGRYLFTGYSGFLVLWIIHQPE